MTCIVAIKDIDQNRVWLAGDRALGNLTMDEPKILKHNNTLAGFSGHRGVITRCLEDEPLNIIFNPLIEDLAYQKLAMAKLREFFIKNVLSEQWLNAAEYGVSILCSAGKSIIWITLPNFTIVNVSGNYYSIGSGWQWALGAFEATKNLTNLLIEDKMLKSLEAAATWDPGNVRAPFDTRFVSPI